MSGNSIKYIPPLISSLSKLEILALDNNEIVEFPEGLVELTELKHLWLRQNKLIELPDDLDKLSALVTLSVSSNVIEIIPSCTTQLRRYGNAINHSFVSILLPTACNFCMRMETKFVLFQRISTCCLNSR